MTYSFIRTKGAVAKASVLAGLILIGSPLYAQTSPLTITLGSQETLWVDTNKCSAQGPRAAWLSFLITNTGTTDVSNVTVVFAGFTGTGTGMSQPSYFSAASDQTRTFSKITAGAKEPVYFYVDYSAVCSHPHGGGDKYAGYTANYTVTVNASGYSAVVRNGSVITNSLVTASAAGQALAWQIDAGFWVGQLLTQTVTYGFGNNKNLFFQPAGEAGFDAACIRLMGSEITGVTGTVPGSLVGMKDQLWFPNADIPGSGGNIAVAYTWEIQCTNRSQLLHPWAAAESGNRFKYTGFADSPQTFSPSQPALIVSKSVSPNSLPDNTGGPVTWTVTFSSSAGLPTILSKITDVLPACMSINNPAASGSEVTAANSSSLPSVGATGTVNWVGMDLQGSNSTYQVPANGTLTLVYRTNITGCSFPASYTNSVTGTVGTTTVGPATATLTLGGTPGISLTKTANPTNYNAVGQVITYTFAITNSGNVPLAGPFSVSDNKLGTLTNCASGPLAVGASTNTCTATHTITQADLDTGSIVNTATATTTYGGNTVTSNQAQATVTGTQTRSLGLAKSPSPTTYNAVGQAITYTYTVTNTGNVTLGPAQFTISDNLIGSPVGTPFNCGPANTTLAPTTGTVTCTATYAITQADLDAGSVTNTATASGAGLSSLPAQATVTATQTKALALTKIPSPATYGAVGQSITYTYTIRNSGNVTLAGPFTVTDDKQGSISPCGSGPLAPNGTTSCTSAHTITLADLVAGSITNIATASGNGVTSNQATATVTAIGLPPADLLLVKTDGSLTYTPGVNVVYTITVTNQGPSANAGFTVTDVLPTATSFVSASPGCAYASGAVTCTSGALAVGDTVNWTVTILPSAARTGCLMNTASVAINPTPDPNAANNSSTDIDSALGGIPQASGLGLSLSYPSVGGNNTSLTAVTYNTGTTLFTLDSTPATALFQAGDSGRLFSGSPTLAVRAMVGSTGVLSGGVVGDDLVLTGTVTDRNGVTYTGTLLTGEVIRFGFQELGGTDRFQLQFVVTGGTMASLFSGKDLGITITAESSTFANSFAANFQSRGKFSLGAVAKVTCTVY